MGVNTVDFGGGLATAHTGRLPSPSIWKDCPWHDLKEMTNQGPGEGPGGICFHDDFEHFPLAGTQTTQIGHGDYKVFNTGSGTIRQVSAVNSVEQGGGILANNVDTDNDSGSIAQSYPSLMVTGLDTNSGKLWWEARVAWTPITTNGLGWFLGLAEVEQWTLATAVPLNAWDAITNSASAIGFRKPEDDTTTYDTVYSDRATSFTAVGDAEGTGYAAFTWVKLGMIYDPSRSTDCVRFFVNGVQTTSVVSRATLTGLTNLDANALGMLLAIVADSAGTSGEFYMDWWRYAQLLPTV